MSFFHKYYAFIIKNPVRSLLTLLQLALGVAIAIVVINLNFSLEKMASMSFEEYKNDFGVFYIQHSSSAPISMASLSTRPVSQPNLIDLVADDPSIKDITGLEMINKQLKIGSRNYITTAYRGDHKLTNVIPLKMLHGSYITKEDESKNVAVISETYAKTLFGRTNVVGEKLKTQLFSSSITLMASGFQRPETNFTIIGVYQDLPYTVRNIIGKIHLIHTKEADAASINISPTIYVRSEKDRLTEVHTLLTQKAKELYGNNTEIVARNAGYLQTSSSSGLDTLKKNLIIIAIAAIIVSSIGILSVMISTVSNKYREIGIKRSLGATKARIFKDMLIETFYLTLSGTILGIVLANLISPFLYREMILSIRELQEFYFTEFSLLPSSIIVIVLFTLLLGIIFGIYPAKLAADIPPAEALSD